jgi:hypothetical protein
MPTFGPRASIGVLFVCVLVSCGLADDSVPRVPCANAIAGFTMDLPEDWEMCTGDLGATMVALDADAGIPTAAVYPVLWFLRTTAPPAKVAEEIAASLNASDGSSPTVTEAGGGEWIVSASSSGPRGALVEEWHCRQEGDRYYVIASMVRPERADEFRDEIRAAIGSCRLTPTPPLVLFTEPTEGAYRMVLPADWRWEGRTIRTAEIPGYFQWEAKSEDALVGAFSAPPGVFNIATPYTEASEAAERIVLPALQAKLPGARLESVRVLPRPGEYYEAAIRSLGIGDHPHVHKCRADYVAVHQGVRVRARVTIATLMLNASPVLGGRGNWMMLTSGYWAPEDRFDELAPLGRGVVASVMTDPGFKRSQFEAANEVAVWRAWNRDLSFWRFMLRLWSN